MKLSVLIVFMSLSVTSLAFTKGQWNRLDDFNEECQKETEVSQDLIDQTRDGKFADDPKLKKQIMCVCKNLGAVDDDGKIIVPVFRSRALITGEDEKVAEDAVKKCCSDEEGSKEEYLRQCLNCIYKEIPTYSLV